MKLDKRKPSGLEKDEQSIKLLAELREKLHSDDPSIRRKAAFNLSWMQEDGLEILKEALFGHFSRRAKTAAAYGLRKMQGRMKKTARALFETGIKSGDKETRYVCNRAIALLSGKTLKTPQPRKRRSAKIEIRETHTNGNLKRNHPKRQQRSGNRREVSGNRRYRTDQSRRGPARGNSR